MDASHSLSGMTFQELVNTPIPEERWVLNGVFPSGCSMLGGTIKLGKSALAEWAACTLGKEKRIAYFAMEYSQNTAIKRFKHLSMKGFDPDKLKVWHQHHLIDSRMPPLDYFRQQAARHAPELIVVDTLASIKQRNSGGYQEEWSSVMKVREEADRMGADLILLHHTRKTNTEHETDPREAFLGSQGIGAAVDNLILYDRPKGSTRLRGFGRSVDDFETFLNFDQGVFTIENENQVKLDLLRRQAPAEHATLLAMDGGSVYHKEILERLTEEGKTENPISSDRLYQILNKLEEKGLIRRPGYRGGQWQSLLSISRKV